jgi:hypothetical protein
MIEPLRAATENAIALKTFLGSKDPDVNATIFMV